MTLPHLIDALAATRLTAFPSLTAARLAAALVRECRSGKSDAAELAKATGEKERAVPAWRGKRKGKVKVAATQVQKAS